MRATPYHRGAHLSDADLLAAVNRCPACLSLAPRQTVHVIQREPDVTLLACNECGIASASRMPTPDALDRYYDRYYTPGAPALTFADPARFARHIVARLPRGLAEGGASSSAEPLRLLDFGGGDGSLAQATALAALDRIGRRKADITVVDGVEPAVSTDARVTVRRVDTLDDCTTPHDIILASAVLEHIPEVGATLRALVARAAPGALFYSRTPYWAPALSIWPGLDLTFPGHVHDMGPPFWNRVITTFGLDAKMLCSRPSIVETSWRSQPLRTAAAHALKLPSRLETRLRRPGWMRPLWGIVGGWEVFLELRSGDGER